MKKEYKIFLKKTFKFLLLLLLVELSLGTLAQHLFFQQETGKYARIINTVNKAEAGLFVFGSSHALRHYVPDVLAETTGLSAHNAGVLGQDLLFSTALQEMVLSRTKPEVIILNIDEEWLNESEKEIERLTELSPYYWHFPEIIKPRLKLYSDFEHLKLYLRTYQYNSTIAHIIKYSLIPQPDKNGYAPLYGKLSSSYVEAHPPLSGKEEQEDTSSVAEVAAEKEGEEKQQIDEMRVEAFYRFINLTKNKGVKLVLVRSPLIRGERQESPSYQLMEEIAHKENIPLLNLSDDKRFVGNYRLYHDPVHLNDQGARLMSGIVADFINKTYQKGQLGSGNM